MSLLTKYSPVMELANNFWMKDSSVTEENGVLKVYGVVRTQYEKNKLWDKIKEIGGEMPSDIQADIRVENTDYYHIHEVVSGDTLSKIAKHYYGDPMKYPKIFEANRDQLDNPDLIKVGQKLKIPFVD